MKKVKLENLSDELAKEVVRYGEDLNKKVEEETRKTIDEAYVQLIKKAPISSKPRKGDTLPRYKTTWKKSVRKIGDTLYATIKQTTDKYKLTHLLEFGHELHQGGRARAKKHITTTELEAKRKARERIVYILYGKGY